MCNHLRDPLEIQSTSWPRTQQNDTRVKSNSLERNLPNGMQFIGFIRGYPKEKGFQTCPNVARPIWIWRISENADSRSSETFSAKFGFWQFGRVVASRPYETLSGPFGLHERLPFRSFQTFWGLLGFYTIWNGLASRPFRTLWGPFGFRASCKTCASGSSRLSSNPIGFYTFGKHSFSHFFKTYGDHLDFERFENSVFRSFQMRGRMLTPRASLEILSVSWTLGNLKATASTV